MMPRLYLPVDSLARAVGADEVAVALAAQARERNLPLDLQRTSSRGLYWLEPLLEMDSPQGRIGFGPLTAADVPSLLDALQVAQHRGSCRTLPGTDAGYAGPGARYENHDKS